MSHNQNNQRELEASQQPNEEVAILEEQLREAVAAEDFFNLASGKVWLTVISKDIDGLVKEITSDKFINDHEGYLEALGRLRQARRSIRLMQVAASPVRRSKIQEKIDEHGE